MTYIYQVGEAVVEAERCDHTQVYRVSCNGSDIGFVNRKMGKFAGYVADDGTRFNTLRGAAEYVAIANVAMGEFING